MSNLAARLLSAAVAVPVLVFIFYYGGLPFLILIEAAIVLGVNEYYNMIEQRGLAPNRVTGLLSALALGAIAAGGRLDYMMLLLTVLMFVIMAQGLRSPDISTAITASASTLFGVLYIGLLLSHAILIRFPPDTLADPGMMGFFFIILAIGGTFLADAGAYFAGRAFGRRKLAPHISPGKTVEGALGGIAGGTAGIIAVKLFFDQWLLPEGTGMPLVHCLILGPILVCASIGGDLFESMLKRDAGVKDSGTLIPGHGGIMDRLDSILMSVPVAYYYLRLVVYRSVW